ncbi:MAG: GatB/YqeY domain-containing protein [Candidatus Jorgensenbacteria bacterium]
MTLQETITQDTISALKSGQELRLVTLRMLQAAVHNREIEKHGKGETAPLTDEEVSDVVRREAKKRKEAIELYKQGGRDELAKKESEELAVLAAYLPPELSAEELEGIVRPIVEKAKGAGITEFGKVMGMVMTAAKGKADAKAVGELVKKFLSS